MGHNPYLNKGRGRAQFVAASTGAPLADGYKPLNRTRSGGLARGLDLNLCGEYLLIEKLMQALLTGLRFITRGKRR